MTDFSAYSRYSDSQKLSNNIYSGVTSCHGALEHVPLVDSVKYYTVYRKKRISKIFPRYFDNSAPP